MADKKKRHRTEYSWDSDAEIVQDYDQDGNYIKTERRAYRGYPDEAQPKWYNPPVLRQIFGDDTRKLRNDHDDKMDAEQEALDKKAQMAALERFTANGGYGSDLEGIMTELGTDVLRLHKKHSPNTPYTELAKKQKMSGKDPEEYQRKLVDYAYAKDGLGGMDSRNGGSPADVDRNLARLRAAKKKGK